MNAGKEIRDHLIAARMQYWLDIARTPILNRRCPTWRARKNFWALVRKHTALAARLAYTEDLTFHSPLHALQQQESPPLPQDSNLPAQEDKLSETPDSPTDANSPVPGQPIESQPARLPAARAPRHFWSLEHEVV
jgi:hypothetical protein